jgi:hypothetical protein
MSSAEESAALNVVCSDECMSIDLPATAAALNKVGFQVF